jgi:hypothetical protein
METILRILERAGGYRPTLYLRVENPPYMVLVIEAMPEPGPLGLPAISIAHYGKQNGDLMRGPEMCFELAKPLDSGIILDPYYWRNDYVGVEQFSRAIVRGHYVALSQLHQQHQHFASTWDSKLDLEGFAEAFTDGAIHG